MRRVIASCIIVLACLGLYGAITRGFGVTEITTKTPQVQAATSVRFEPSGNEFVDAINRVRVANGVEPLVIDNELMRIANNRVDDMQNKQYYAHTNPDGLTYDAYFDGLPTYSCENLNLSETADSAATIQDWLRSSTHRDCLLNARVKTVGVAQINYLSDNETFITAIILASN